MIRRLLDAHDRFSQSDNFIERIPLSQAESQLGLRNYLKTFELTYEKTRMNPSDSLTKRSLRERYWSTPANLLAPATRQRGEELTSIQYL
jgi:hypothetical protein